MSTEFARIVLDNTVVSSLQEAGALILVLELWPGRWLIPLEVRDEAAAWRKHGTAVLSILQALEIRKVLELTAVEPRQEGPLYARLNRTLGKGESAVIAIASHRRLLAALDDRRARRSCDRLSPPVQWMSTEDILGQAVAESLISRGEAQAIWSRTGIIDSSRQIP